MRETLQWFHARAQEGRTQFQALPASQDEAQERMDAITQATLEGSQRMLQFFEDGQEQNLRAGLDLVREAGGSFLELTASQPTP